MSYFSFCFFFIICLLTHCRLVNKKRTLLQTEQVSMGAIHSTKISGNFGPKLNGSVRSNWKSFEKTGPPFEVVLFSRSDRLEVWLNGSRPMYPVCAKGYFFSATRRTRNTKNASSHFLLTSSPEKRNSFLAKRTFMPFNPIEEFLNCGNVPVFLCFRLK